MSSQNDEIVSKSRQRRIIKKVRQEGLPILAETITACPGLLTEHVADIVEGADVRIATRKMLNTPVPAAVSARLAAALFGSAVNPTTVITSAPQTATMARIEVNDEVVEGEIEDDGH